MTGVTHNGRAVDSVEGVVEQVNGSGLKLGGTWYSVSKFTPVELPAAGAHVRVVADDKRFIKTIEVLESLAANRQEIADSSASGKFAGSAPKSLAVDYLQDIRDLLRAQISTLSSVQLERTSRGVNVSVKCYATDLAEAARLAEAEYDRLASKYDAG